MKLRMLEPEFTVCKVADFTEIDLERDFCFLARTDAEYSVVCPVSGAPGNTLARDDGWRAFRIEGELDFALIGILARLSAVLAEAEIGIFAISTYNTDYILTKSETFARAIDALRAAGYQID